MKRTILLLTLIALLTACSKEAQLSRRLVGQWNVDVLELSTSGSLPLSSSIPNVGTISFDEDGTGQNNIAYQYKIADFEVDVEDNSSFVWENSETQVDVISDSKDVGQLLWEVEINEKTNQVWYRTAEDGIKSLG